MKNVLKVNPEKRIIVMDRAFSKNAYIVGTDEYEQLQMCRRDYPKFKVVLRQIKKNPKKESYSGLTYQYMEDYILRKESKENVMNVLKEFADMRIITECHSKPYRYPKVKEWFLKRYPEIITFGMSGEKTSSDVSSPLSVDDNAAA